MKLEVGSCDCSTDFTQCNYCSDTRTERYKEKKEALQVISTKHWEKSNGESMRNFEAIKPHQEQQGGKCFTSSSHSLTFVENYSN